MRITALATLLVAACGAADPVTTPSPAPTKSDGPEPNQPAAVGLRLEPDGRYALATGEPLALKVTALDASGAATDVTAGASFDVRDPGAGGVVDGVFTAGPDGSRATTILARYGGLVSNPVLVSTLTPLVTEDFEVDRAVTVTGDGGSGGLDATSDNVLDGNGSLVIKLDGRAGQHLRVTLPLAAPVALTNVERALIAYRLTGDAQLTLQVGALNGDAGVVAVNPATLALTPGASDLHASLQLSPASFDSSWDARALVLDLTFTADGTGTLVLDDLRLLRQFIVGANLAWLDGAYQHDFGRSFHHPDWGVTYTAEHSDAVLKFCQDHGIRLLRVWVFEDCEGLVKDAKEIVTGLDATLLASFDDFVFNRLPKYDVKVEFMLLASAHVTECTSPSPIPAGAARTAFLEQAVRPFVERYGSSPWVWGVDLANEPEGAVGGSTGNWSNGTDWDTMRSFLTDAAKVVRQTAPRLYVSAGSGWHDAENITAGRFSGLGFTHLDFHSYNDGGDVPDYPALLRHARVLLGEVGQGSDKYDDAQQSATLSAYLEAADSFNYWGVLAWAVDHPGSTDRLSLLAKDSSYDDMRGRPAADVLRDFTAGRGDVGP
jgi:hypothetical protein